MNSTIDRKKLKESIERILKADESEIEQLKSSLLRKQAEKVREI